MTPGHRRRCRVFGKPGVGSADVGFQIGWERLPGHRLADPATHRCELLDILGIQCGQLGVDHLGQAALGDELPVGIRGGGESVRYAYARCGEVADHLAQRGVLAAHLIDVGETKVREPRDG